MIEEEKINHSTLSTFKNDFKALKKDAKLKAKEYSKSNKFTNAIVSKKINFLFPIKKYAYLKKYNEILENFYLKIKI